MKLDEQLAAKFECAKCRSSGGEASRFAATGTGFSRFFDIQHKKFITVSCRNCGYTEIYNPRIMEKQDRISDVIDFIFGG